MSDTLPLHTGRKADYKETIRLIVPFSSSAEAVLPDHRALLLWLSGKRPGAFRRSPGTAGYAAFRRHVGQRRLKRRPRREASEHPVWELLRSGKVKAVKDVSELLHP